MTISLDALLAISAGMLLRSIVSLHSYSGEATPPMYGDFEAQRHWQEITFNLPILEWYENSTNNDLMYWGLDYPPLTAYHSLAMGKVANYVNETYVSLKTSRGLTSDDHKTFMRSTVLVADLLVYIPAILFCCKAIYKNIWKSSYADNGLHKLHVVVALLYPGQILIDNGHFQYNNISLGFAAFAITFMLWDRTLLGAVFFVLALNYKQMELYHALPIFWYLLANCFFDGKKINIYQGLKKLIKLGICVLLSFTVLWFPWLHSLDKTLQVIHRIFPLARGVYEDKVANVWCVLNVIYPIKQIFTNEEMALLCFTLTVAALTPNCLHLLLKPNKKTLLLSLINSSLTFFLFSFQVHEKSILLVTLPITLYFPMDPLACLWFLQIATFSMLPLLLRDGLLLAYLSLNILYLLIIKVAAELLLTNRPNNLEHWADIFKFVRLFVYTKQVKSKNKTDLPWRFLFLWLFYFSLLGTILLSLLLVVVHPPADLPHIFPLLISAYSCAHFVLFFLYFNVKQMYLS